MTSSLAHEPRWPSLPATRLVCTIGPASQDRIAELIEAGMSVARLNFAHGSPAEHVSRAAALRAAAAAAGREIAILADLPGPKVRLGPLEAGAVELAHGATFTLLAGLDALDGPGDAARAATSHPGIAGDLRPGDHVHLADGAVELVVVAVGNDGVRTVVERAGRIRSGAGVNVPAERLSLPALSARDRQLAVVALEAGVDLVGQSFVCGADDVGELRSLLGPGGPGIIAKIETRPAVERFEAIAVAADGVMVARGDLGLEVPFEDVPLLQKRLVAAATARRRPVIVATQMLESMITAPRPTRAEASDVANAVLDGADAVMLSGETAIGAHPVLAARAAIRICAAAERESTGWGPPEPGRDEAVALAAVALADADDRVTALVVAGRDDHTARAVASRRPRVPVVAVVGDAATQRRLVPVRGVRPIVPAGRELAAAPGDAVAGRVLDDAAVRTVLPAAGRAVFVGTADGRAADRIELADLPGPATSPSEEA